MKNFTLIAIYDKPEKFPPTLNAIKEMLSSGRNVVVLFRNTERTSLNFELPCKLVDVADDGINKSVLHKLFIFLKFTIKLLYCNWRYKPTLNLVYDSYSISSFNFIRHFIPNTKIWYHNHDVTDLDYVNKKSLTYWCWKIEQKFVKKVDVFSLPDLSRAKYFVRRNLIAFLPNYPNLSFKTTYNKRLNTENRIKVLYQGRVSAGHGILELIKYIEHSLYHLEFHIIGNYDILFEKDIKEYVKVHQLTKKIFFYDSLPYHELKLFSENFDVGLGVLQPLNAAYSTAATASNKIYEYVAMGMPVILFDNEHYKQTLELYTWAKFTDMSIVSFDKIFEDLARNYNDYSQQAYADYRRLLHFENYFYPIYKDINH